MQRHTCELQVLDRVHERATHEKLRTKVVDKLRVLLTAQTHHMSMRGVATRAMPTLHATPSGQPRISLGQPFCWSCANPDTRGLRAMAKPPP